MSTEDELAREDALTYVDAHTPMALDTSPAVSGWPHDPVLCGKDSCTHGLEPKPKPRTRRPKQDPIARACQAGYLKAMKLAERYNRKMAAEQKKRDTVARKIQEAADAKAAKLLAAEGGHVELPAVVLRDGTVRHVNLNTAVEITEQYLEDLFLDCETSGYWVGHQHYELRTVQLGGEEMAVVLDAADEKQMQVASWALRAAARVWAHSVMADAIPCVVHGLVTWDEIWGKAYDSVIKAKLTDPALCGSEADKLKDLARDILREYAVSPAAEVAKDELFRVMGTSKKTDVLTPPEKNGWYQVKKTAVTMIRYAGSDVLDLAAVVRVLPPLPVPEEVMERERVTQAMCAVSAYTGWHLDLPRIRKKITEHEEDQELSRRIVEHLTGGRLKNPASSGEVLAYLVEQGHEAYPLKVNRKTKKVTAGKESLEPIAKREDAERKPPLARNIVDYRHDGTTLGLLLRPLENLCVQGDGRMRPMVYTINAKTGRMSCVRPNGQQFSRQGGIRACVKAGEMNLELTDGKWEVTC